MICYVGESLEAWDVVAMVEHGINLNEMLPTIH